MGGRERRRMEQRGDERNPGTQTFSSFHLSAPSWRAQRTRKLARLLLARPPCFCLFAHTSFSPSLSLSLRTGRARTPFFSPSHTKPSVGSFLLSQPAAAKIKNRSPSLSLTILLSLFRKRGRGAQNRRATRTQTGRLILDSPLSLHHLTLSPSILDSHTHTHRVGARVRAQGAVRLLSQR